MAVIVYSLTTRIPDLSVQLAGKRNVALGARSLGGAWQVDLTPTSNNSERPGGNMRKFPDVTYRLLTPTVRHRWIVSSLNRCDHDAAAKHPHAYSTTFTGEGS